jgi:hypothetical protein
MEAATASLPPKPPASGSNLAPQRRTAPVRPGSIGLLATYGTEA